MTVLWRVQGENKTQMWRMQVGACPNAHGHMLDNTDGYSGAATEAGTGIPAKFVIAMDAHCICPCEPCLFEFNSTNPSFL